LTKRINSNVSRSTRTIGLDLLPRGCAYRIAVVATVEIHIIVVIEPVPAAATMLVAADIVRDGRGLAEAARRRNMPVFVDENDHPYADGA
jgi:hypothetical protein